MSVSRHRLVDVIFLVALALVGAASQAAAADFYPFGAADQNALVLIEPDKIQVTSEGHKIVALNVVTVDDLGDGAPSMATLDTTTVEVDCAQSRWKVLSEYLYGTLSPTSESTDKTSSNPSGWQDLPAKGLLQSYRTFACKWPKVKPHSSKAKFPDLETAANAAANIIDDDIRKSRKH